MPQMLRQVLPHGVMLVASVLLYWAATKIEADTGGRIGPAVWPKAIIVFMGLLCAYEIVKRLVAKSSFEAKGVIAGLDQNPMASEFQASDRPGSDPAEAIRSADHRGSDPMLYGGIGIIAAYVLAVPYLGFFVTTALFLTVFPWIGGMRRPVLATVIGLVGSLVLVLMFMRVAYISLPLGEGPFRAVSLALMRALGVS